MADCSTFHCSAMAGPPAWILPQRYYLPVSTTTRRRMCLAHLTVLDTTPPELVSVAAAAGFGTIGIRLTATPSVGVPPYDILHEGPMLRETLLRLADTGVSVLDTEFLRFEPELPVGVPERFLEVSARLGAKNVLVMSAEPEDERTLERFGELCDSAAEYDLTVGLEFAIYTGVRTLAHAADIVARSKRSNAAELIDALPAGVPLAIEAPCRATADLPALERAKRANRALSALTGA